MGRPRIRRQLILDFVSQAADIPRLTAGSLSSRTERSVFRELAMLSHFSEAPASSKQKHILIPPSFDEKKSN